MSALLNVFLMVHVKTHDGQMFSGAAGFALTSMAAAQG
jgi:hypothetical protein